MTALNFPASPSSGDVHNAANGLQYAFDGVKWTSQGTYDTGAINAQKLDNIDTSGQPFNGSNTTFALKVNNNTIKPHNEQSLSIVLNGHLQEPVTAYTTSQANGTITFATAPANGTTFFGVLLSRLPVAGSILDGSVTNVKVANDAAIDGTKINPNFGSQTITGVTTTQSSTDNTTKLASTAFVQTAIANLVDNSPATLNTLNELAAALNDDADFSTTITTALAAKAPTNNPTFTGTVSGISYADLSNKPPIPSNTSDLTNDSGFITATLTNEQVQDIVGGMVSSGAQSGITVLYDENEGAGDGTGKLNFSVSNTNTANQTWNDGAKALFGTDGGLEIYHDASDSNSANHNSIISETGGGGLLIYGSDIILHKPGTSERLADFAQSGSARLYWGGATTPKLATSSTGVTVDGTVTATSFSGDGSNLTGITSSSLDSSIQLTSSNISDAFADDAQLVLGNGANDSDGVTDDALVLYYGPPSGQTTNYGIISADNGLHLQYDGSNRLETHPAGTKWQSDLFCDDGNKIKLGNQAALQIHHSVDTGGDENSFIDARGDVVNGSHTNSGGLLFYAKDFIFHEQSNGNHRMAAFAQDGGDGARLYYDNDIKIQTTDYGIATKDIVVTSNQNEKLALAGSSNPFIRFREGTTNKAYIQWLDTGVLQIVNEESGEILKIHDGNNGLTYTVDGTERTVYHTGNLTPFSGNYNDLSNKPTNVSTFTNDAGYLTSAPAPTASQINDAFPDDGTLVLGSETITNGVGQDDALKLYFGYPTGQTSGEQYGFITADAGVHLQFDGTTRLETHSAGTKWSGDLFADAFTNSGGGKIKMGPSGALQIYHDGSNSVIDDTGTGGLLVYGSDIIFQKHVTSGTAPRMADFAQDGAVRLYENGTIRLTTTDAGVDVSGNIVVSGTVDGIDLQTLNTAVSANTAKVSNATHTGEVTGSGALTIANNVVDEANLKVSNDPTNGYVLTAQSGNTGGLTWAAATSSPTTSSINALFGDNDNLILGNAEADGGSADDALKLYYDGTNGIITADNGVKIQYDGSPKITTTNTGVDVNGNIVVSGTVDGRNLSSDGSKLDGIANNANNYSLPTASTSQLGGIKVGNNLSITNGVLNATASGGGATGFEFNDNVRIKFGADDDLQLFHDTNNSVIDGTGTGSLLLYGSDIIFQEKSDGSHRMADFAQDGSTGCRLYYDNGVKLQTTSSGITCGNIIVSTSQDQKIILTGSTNPYIRFQEGSTNKAYIQWYGTDGKIYIVNQESGEYITIGSGNSGLQFVVDGTARTVYHTGNLPTIPTNNNQLTNGAGYITSDSTKLPLSGGTVTGALTVGTSTGNLTIGNGSSNARILCKKADNNTADHIIFYNGTTRVGEIGVEDNSWLRINQETANNIYTPRMIRADGGFQVDNITVVDGSANIIGARVSGTVANATRAENLGGASASVSAGNNTIVKRHSSGYIFANYFNTTPNDINTGSITKICAESGNDGYIRHATAAAVRSFINVENGATADQTASDINNLYPDNGNLILGTGTGSDTMKLYYNGSVGIITSNAGVILQYNGSTKFYTKSNGARCENALFINNDTRYLREPSGNYGSIQISGSGYGGWEGFSIDGRVVFMHSGGTDMGIYNDVNNEWMFYGIFNSYTAMYFNGSQKIKTESYGAKVAGTIRPHTTNGGDCGASDARWGTVYASNGSINTSDRNEKNSILEADLGLDFINKLKPVSYKWNDTRLGKKTHYGLIAQEVEEAIEKVGKDVDDIAMVENPEFGPKGLYYNEIIGPLVKSVQELSAKVAALEAA